MGPSCDKGELGWWKRSMQGSGTRGTQEPYHHLAGDRRRERAQDIGVALRADGDVRKVFLPANGGRTEGGKGTLIMS